MRGLDLSPEERQFIEASRNRSGWVRRTRQFLNLNSVALMIAASLLMSYYLWRVVPSMAAMVGGLALELPISTKLAIAASNILVDYLPLWVIAAGLLYRYRKRVQASEYISMGMVFTVVLGWGILLIQFGQVALLLQVVREFPSGVRRGLN